MKTYTLPTEPPIGTLLQAADGTIWKADTWTTIAGEEKIVWHKQNQPTKYPRRLNWKEMLTRNNATPLTEIPDPPKIGDSHFDDPEWLDALPDDTAIATSDPRTNITRIWRKDCLTWHCADIDSDSCTSEYVTENEEATIIWLPEETK